MSRINEMITNTGSAFSCTADPEPGTGRSIRLNILRHSDEASVCMELEDFLHFADFVENTRARLLSGK